MRRTAVGASTALIWLASAPALAHGLGGLGSLPAPVETFVAAVVVALIFAFLVLSAVRPAPLAADDDLVVTVKAIPQSVIAALRILGSTGFVVVVIAGLIGEPSLADNPAPVLAFVWFWLAVPVVSALVGDIYPYLDPWRQLWRAFSIADERRSSVLPAALALLAFGWFLLVSPWRDPFHVAIGALVYGGYVVVMGLAGRRPADVDAFAVYNRMVGGLAPYLRHPDGTTHRVQPLGGLRRMPEQPGTVAFVVAMLAVVVYDGASLTSWWSQSLELPLSRSLFELGLGSTAARALAATAGMAVAYAALLIAYVATCVIAARLAGDGHGRTVVDRFAHTLVPAAFAFSFSHYFTLIGTEGRRLIPTMSDPFGLGWNLFGTSDRTISAPTPEPAAWIWWVQVLVMAVGHVASLSLVHERSLTDFPGARSLRAEYPFLVLLAVLAGLGLVILATG